MMIFQIKFFGQYAVHIKTVEFPTLFVFLLVFVCTHSWKKRKIWTPGGKKYSWFGQPGVLVFRKITFYKVWL